MKKPHVLVNPLTPIEIAASTVLSYKAGFWKLFINETAQAGYDGSGLISAVVIYGAKKDQTIVLEGGGPESIETLELEKSSF